VTPMQIAAGLLAVIFIVMVVLEDEMDRMGMGLFGFLLRLLGSLLSMYQLYLWLYPAKHILNP
jgi:hypothetical protein